MEGFTFFKSYLDQIEKVPEEHRLAVYEAICRYAIYGEEPDFSDGSALFADLIFTGARPTLDAAIRKSENGKAGGRGNKKQEESTDAEPEKQTESKPKANGKQTESKPKANQKQTESYKYMYMDKDMDKDKDVDKDMDMEKDMDKDVDDNNTLVRSASMSESALTEEFNREIWDLYPRSRRNGKKKALASYIRDRKNGADKTEVILGINRYRAYITATHLEERFIKQADTFFNQSAWQDAWEPPRGSVDHTTRVLQNWLAGEEAAP